MIAPVRGLTSLPERLLLGRVCKRPIFVVGANRSGTTILLEALDQHPAVIAAGGEVPVISYVGVIASHFEGNSREHMIRSTRVGPDDLYQSLRWLCFHCAMGTGSWLYFRRVAVGLVRDRNPRVLRTRRWSAKIFPSAEAYRGLIGLFPAAKFVYIYRNGCDVVQSRTRFPGFRELGFEQQCRDWARHIETYAYLLKAEQAMAIRQEDLRDAPARVFQQLLPFLELAADERPARFVQTTLIRPLDEASQKNIDVRQAFKERPAPHASWTPDQKETFRRFCGPAMERMGYDVPF